ncbi:MAG: PD-(D/E)XK nuclease family protein [Pirellulaceae bacterium]|nr:PD-(D/E)XK nuclease family protein [Pirellulaceae bacterium]
MTCELQTQPGAAGAARQGSVWDYVSPSRLSLWAKCPLAWRLRYLDGVESPTTPSLFVGKLCHAGLEVFYRHRQRGVTLAAEDVRERLDTIWNEAIDQEGQPFANTEEAAKAKGLTQNLVRAYLDQLPADEPGPLAVEAVFEAPLVDPATGEDLGIPLLGIVDVVFDAAEGPVVVDFKTAASAAEPAEVVHEIQLGSYAYLLRRSLGRTESEVQIRSLVKTRQPRVLVHRYAARTEAHFARLFALLREYVDALDARRFNYRPGWTCASCDFRETHCRQWSG